MSRNKSIDFLKFAFSVGIIAIHISFMKNFIPQVYNMTAQGLLRLGVPFFFVVTGYYFYGRIQNNQDTKNYMKKLIKLFLTFTIIESIIYLWAYIWSLNNPIAILLYVFKSLTVGQGGIYWYMSSLILSLLLLRPFWKKGQIKPLLFVGLALYLLTATNDVYGAMFAGSFIQNIAKVNTYLFCWPQAGLCSSLLWLSIGAVLYKHKPEIKNLSVNLGFALLVLVGEALFFQNTGAYDANCYLSLIVATPLLFLYTLKNDFIHFETKRLGLMSTYMYMVHPIVIIIFRWTIPPLNSTNELLFLLTMIVTTAISYFLTRPKKNA